MLPISSILYALELADTYGIDIEEAIEKKLKKNSQKYPVEKSKGRSIKYTKL